MSAGTLSPPRSLRTRRGMRPSESSCHIRCEISRERRCARVDCGAALGDKEDVKKGIEGYGRERRKLLMLKDAEILENGCSLQR